MFDLYEHDGKAIFDLMARFQSGDIHLSDSVMSAARELFTSARVDDDETCAEIARVWSACEYMLDPHTAIGTKAARDCMVDPAHPMVTLATAHPAKFPEAISHAGVSRAPELPLHLTDLFDREERFTVLPNDLIGVQAFMAGHCAR